MHNCDLNAAESRPVGSVHVSVRILRDSIGQLAGASVATLCNQPTYAGLPNLQYPAIVALLGGCLAGMGTFPGRRLRLRAIIARA